MHDEYGLQRGQRDLPQPDPKTDTHLAEAVFFTFRWIQTAIERWKRRHPKANTEPDRSVIIETDNGYVLRVSDGILGAELVLPHKSVFLMELVLQTYDLQQINLVLDSFDPKVTHITQKVKNHG